MFQSVVLKSALAAIAMLEIVEAQNKTDYQDFLTAMAGSKGQGYDWDFHNLTSADGYETTMFRITKDAAGAILPGYKGPILLTHGLYSGVEDWLLQDSDPTLPSTPIQLANLGYDVWMAASRGREVYSRTHTTLDPNDPIQGELYWDYSFETVGLNDYPAMIDKIIDTRKDACSKVTIVTHSSGSNSALVLAAADPALQDKVDRIVSLAPCLEAEIDNFWLPLKDLSSIAMFYDLLASNGVHSLFGPNHLTNIAPFCAIDDVTNMICQNFLLAPLNNNHLQEDSLKAFRHIHQNSVISRFQEYIPEGADGIDVYTNPYPLSLINIPVFGIFGQDDDYCPPAKNEYLMTQIPDLTSIWVAGADHIDLIADNNVELTDFIAQCLPIASVPITNLTFCPQAPPVPIPDEKSKDKSGSDKSCHSSNKSGSEKSGSDKVRSEKSGSEKSGSDKQSKTKQVKGSKEGSSGKSGSEKSGSDKEPKIKGTKNSGSDKSGSEKSGSDKGGYDKVGRVRASRTDRLALRTANLNDMLDMCVDEMTAFLDNGEGKGQEIVKDFKRVTKKMDKYGIVHDDLMTIDRYPELLEAIQSECKSSDSDC